jgi:hypothetical protein
MPSGVCAAATMLATSAAVLTVGVAGAPPLAVAAGALLVDVGVAVDVGVGVTAWR